MGDVGAGKRSHSEDEVPTAKTFQDKYTQTDDLETGQPVPPRAKKPKTLTIEIQHPTEIPPVTNELQPTEPTLQIDPLQIPRPNPISTTIIYETHTNKKENPPPPAASQYIVRDTGNCSPRYMRCTSRQVPCTSDCLSACGLQELALLVQPFALPHPSEEPIPAIDYRQSERGPVQCSECDGFMNPFMKFINHGRNFICNLCGFTNDTPQDYHCYLGFDGKRTDADTRQELCRGTIEYLFKVYDPLRVVFFFLIDVSMNAIQTGAVAATCSSIKRVITDLPEGPHTHIGIATFDDKVHFYDLRCTQLVPEEVVVHDIPKDLLSQPSRFVGVLYDRRQHLETVLGQIPIRYADQKVGDSAFTTAIEDVLLLLKNTLLSESNGGKLMIFQSELPSTGVGNVLSRESEGWIRTSPTVKDAYKLHQAGSKTFTTMAEELAFFQVDSWGCVSLACYDFQVCVDIFITSQSYVDVASISVIPKTTGGQVYYYHPFSEFSHGVKLYNDLSWNLRRPQAFQAVMSVKCCQGIQVAEYSGNFYKRSSKPVVGIPVMDCDKAFMVTLKHTLELQEGSECSFQCVVSYTTLDGIWRSRVINLCLPCTNMPIKVLDAADLDTQFTCFMKHAAQDIISFQLGVVREQFMRQYIKILQSYRRLSVEKVSDEVFVLPKSLELLPLYTLALHKSTGFKFDGVKTDERSFWISHVSSLSAALAIRLVYPRLVAIHDRNTKKNGDPCIPPLLRLSHESLCHDGIYLLEIGDEALLCTGYSVEPEAVQQIFGISSAVEIPTEFVLNGMLNTVVTEIRERIPSLHLRFCKESLFRSYMIEDKRPEGPSYEFFLAYTHLKTKKKSLLSWLGFTN